MCIRDRVTVKDNRGARAAVSRKTAWARFQILDPEASPGRGLPRALSQTLVHRVKAMTDSDKEEEVKQKLTALTKDTGVEGADRLAAL